MSDTNDETRAAAGKSVDKEETRAAPSAAVKKLGQGYRGRRFWPRCSIVDSDGNPTPEAPVFQPASVAASALGAGYGYRRPLPCKDEDDAMELGAQDDNKVAALEELEAGLEAAADGPPHQGGADGDGSDDDGGNANDGDDGGDDGGDNGGAVGGGEEDDDDDDDELSTAHSSSLDTEEVIAFAMEWDDGDCAGGPRANAAKLSSSADPAQFQEDHESARSMLAMAAYFASTAKAMVQEHQRARKEADLYMEEVLLATE